MPDVYDKPTDVTPENGQVHLDGPDGVAVSMTPEAAEETGERLIHSSIEAHGQRLVEEEDKRRRGKRPPPTD